MSKFSNFYENKHTILIKFWSKRPYFKTLTLPVYLAQAWKFCAQFMLSILVQYSKSFELCYIYYYKYKYSTLGPKFYHGILIHLWFRGAGEGGGMNWLTLPQHLCIGVWYMIIQLLGQIFFPMIWNDRRSRWKVVWRIQDVWCLAYSWDDIVSNNINK